MDIEEALKELESETNVRFARLLKIVALLKLRDMQDGEDNE